MINFLTKTVIYRMIPDECLHLLGCWSTYIFSIQPQVSFMCFSKYWWIMRGQLWVSLLTDCWVWLKAKWYCCSHTICVCAGRIFSSGLLCSPVLFDLCGLASHIVSTFPSNIICLSFCWPPVYFWGWGPNVFSCPFPPSLSPVSLSQDETVGEVSLASAGGLPRCLGDALRWPGVRWQP